MSFHDKFYSLKDKYLKQGLSETQAVLAAIHEIQYIVATTGMVFA
jgi:hypothetical protein